MAAHVEAMLAALREVAGQHADPYQRLHAVVRAYLHTFADRPHAAFLWFEYWIAAGRRGATGMADTMLSAVRDLLARLLADLRQATGRPAGDLDQAARGLVSWLLGSLVQQQLHPLAPAAVQAEVDRVLGLA